MKKNDVIKQIIRELAVIQPNVPAEKIAAIVSSAVGEWEESIETKLTELTRDWEERMPDDDTLYTLGVRRAIDIVRGKDLDIMNI